MREVQEKVKVAKQRMREEEVLANWGGRGVALDFDPMARGEAAILNEACPVCISDFEPGQRVWRLHCAHAGCDECYEGLLSGKGGTAGADVGCPLCRQPILEAKPATPPPVETSPLPSPTRPADAPGAFSPPRGTPAPNPATRTASPASVTGGAHASGGAGAVSVHSPIAATAAGTIAAGVATAPSLESRSPPKPAGAGGPWSSNARIFVRNFGRDETVTTLGSTAEARRCALPEALRMQLARPSLAACTLCCCVHYPLVHPRSHKPTIQHAKLATTSTPPSRPPPRPLLALLHAPFTASSPQSSASSAPSRTSSRRDPT